ncbi:hypothetical protein GCM10011390_11650 [Aureimonas endophytica]|uniref:Bacterial CdiA-CT RNAse A domain-containing protein n=2 Tax=Aureimonas endophytica TaxID=2027858 RepID=A0A917E2T7_9HYPH|nr:hypothetical protein GCM10011390_11650 [Aureimonas endophytica]
MQSEKVDGLFVSLGIKRSDSFYSLEAATKLVNSTLARNAEAVDRVARGEEKIAFVTSEFPYKTGHEFYLDVPAFSIFAPKDQIRHRDVYGVGVAIVHDSSIPKGFRIDTAYPKD